jgi:hypothetical protein
LITVADLRPSDYILDLGSGDGSLLRELATRTACRGVGVEVAQDHYLSAMEENRKSTICSQRLQFRHAAAEDIMIDASGRVRFPDGEVLEERVTVVYVYVLFMAQNERIQNLLRQFLDLGVRVVTNTFRLPDNIGVRVRSYPDTDTVEGIFEQMCNSNLGTFHVYQGKNYCSAEVARRRIELMERQRELENLPLFSHQEEEAIAASSGLEKQLNTEYNRAMASSEELDPQIDLISRELNDVLSLQRELDRKEEASEREHLLRENRLIESGGSDLRSEAEAYCEDAASRLTEMQALEAREREATRKLRSLHAERLKVQKVMSTALLQSQRVHREVGLLEASWQHHMTCSQEIFKHKAEIRLEQAEERLSSLEEDVRKACATQSGWQC